MPLSLFKTRRTRSKKQNSVLDTDNTHQHIAVPQNETGRRTSDMLQRESVKLMPALRPIYKPLDPRKLEIRLLKLDPGQGRDPLICTMEHTSLISKSHAPYETVSYCWGRNPGETVIELDRLPAKVTLSAARVLYRMRYPNKCRWLWVDAICINQEDDSEKGQQVSMMGTIYRQAWRNLIWLGTDGGHADDVKIALDVILNDVRKETVDFYNLFYLTHTRTPNFDRLRDGTSLSTNSRKCLRTLEQLFSSPWFGRAWVAQEVALARENICHFGDATFSINDVLRVAIWLTHNSTLVPTTLMENFGLNQATMLWYLVDHEFVPVEVFEASTDTLYSAWNCCQWMEASVAKDNVYALLGMVRSQRATQPHLMLVPDYHKSDVEVFRDATRVMIEETRSLEIFQNRSESVNENPTKMPSWVTRFDLKKHNDTGPGHLTYSYDTRDPCLITASTVAPGESLNVLSLRGVQVDHVIRRTNCMPSIFESNVGQLVHEALRAVNPAQADPKDWSWAFSEKFAFTLMAGHNWLSHPVGAKEVDDFVVFMKYMGAHRKNPPAAGYAEMARYDQALQQAMRCFSAIANACSYRRFFVTAAGRFGLGPPGLNKDDIIAELYGGAVPFALRYVSRGKYRYIGACYVYDMMKGEALRKQKAARGRGTVFNLI